MNDFVKKYKSLQKAVACYAGKSFVIISFLISCATMKDGNTEYTKESFTGKLDVLDEKLQLFAKKHNTVVGSPKGTFYNSANGYFNPDSLECREVSWMDGELAKAIVIQPHSDALGPKLNAWDVCNVAWLKDAQSFEKPHWIYYPLKNADIHTLKKNLDQLLTESEEKLRNIKAENLK